MRFAGIFFALLVLSSCGVFSDLSDMHDNTSKMSQSVERTNRDTENVYVGLRQEGAVQVQAQALKDLKSAPDIESKINEAGIFYGAYEFQFWRGDGTDTPEALLDNYSVIFSEYFQMLQQFDPQRRLNLDPTSKDGNMQDLYALAATMHFINPIQQANSDARGIAPVSVESTLENALKQRKSIYSRDVDGRSLPDYERTILENTDWALYLLRLRVNFIAVMVIAKVSGLDDARFYSWLLDKLNINDPVNLVDLIFNFKPKHLADLELAKLWRYDDYMREANRTFDFLNSQDFDPLIDSKVKKLYEHIQLPSPADIDKLVEGPNNQESPEVAVNQAAAIKRLVSDIAEFQDKVQRYGLKSSDK